MKERAHKWIALGLPDKDMPSTHAWRCLECLVLVWTLGTKEPQAYDLKLEKVSPVCTGEPDTEKILV